MKNNTRRNRNIGTAKQGYGQNNKLKTQDYFVEKLTEYTKRKISINGHEFIFVVEDLQTGFQYSCSLDDIVTQLSKIPNTDYGDLKFIVFRQPKKKERMLEPVWGRLMYTYEFEGDLFPAIIIESFQPGDSLKWSKKQSVAQIQEFKLLQEEGHIFIDKGNYYEAILSESAVRNTQLNRTIFHEVGHYVHYLTFVERPSTDEESFEEWENRYNKYFSIPKREKEVFANRYAAKYK
uniref:hypothetical protein n=1 Tax=uncultured Dysgonomonas sp. TaxID=206096 RepID=UPI00261C416F|nr:hypothetical protein [uncultured Dysgonomonas sp.]